MRFSSTLYPYQSEILDIFEKERARGDKKIHIVAPPGSGKTIVGLEMMTRLDVPTLILVPNLTLQEQWKDKIEKLFLESHESSESLISTSINEIKKINIITYQSLSGSDNLDDDINAKILDIWFLSEKDEFEDKNTFLLFVEELKNENPNEYGELYKKHRKKLKESGEDTYTRKLIKGTIHAYVEKLRSAGVQAMIVDEAHHLTAWWSHVLYVIWTDLGNPYIIGLTATPPFESVDFFELDESYTKLLGVVDYYVPTPAIVKSGRLAPYSDLLYIVEPDAGLSDILSKKEKALQDFIDTHKDAICIFLHEFLVENFSRLEVKSLEIMEKWMRFIYVHKGELAIDMSSYITANASKPLTLEDIAKSIGKWGADGFKKTKTSKLLDEIKSLFFDLGYIWRGANLYRFQTPIEKGLIYSKSKILGTQEILKKEEQNMKDNLRVAIITDFLDVESDWINGHFIFDELAKSHTSLNPYLVSGQGIWKLENGIKTETNETILSVTEKLTHGETRLVIGTRGILGEGWDCPAVNTLIDLTGVSAYMSVNQVHGRAIRLDKENPEKVANIYDIICLGHGYQGMRDFERLEKKHSQFYGVDDSGLIIKELDHIYPQLERMIANPEKINAYTLKKSSLRTMVAELWGIGGEYKNEEIFSLSIEIVKPYESLYLPSKIKFRDIKELYEEKKQGVNLLELGNTTYHKILRQGIEEIIDATLQVMRPFGLIPRDFTTFILNWTETGSITIISDYRDPLVSKKFIETIAPLFNTVTNQKYILKNESTEIKLPNLLEIINIQLLKMTRGEYQSLFIISFALLVSSIFVKLFSDIGMLIVINLALLLAAIGIIMGVYSAITRKKHNKQQVNLQDSYINISTYFGLPDSIVSNEEKRRWFTGKEYGAIPERVRWYDWIWSFSFMNLIIRNDINSSSMYFTKKVGFSIIGILTSTLFLLISAAVTKEMGTPFYMDLSTILISLLSNFWKIIILAILCIFGLLILRIALSFFYYFYIFGIKMYNFLKRRKVIQLTGSIEPTSQSDIGKPSFLSAKIEKLWI